MNPEDFDFDRYMQGMIGTMAAVAVEPTIRDMARAAEALIHAASLGPVDLRVRCLKLAGQVLDQIQISIDRRVQAQARAHAANDVARAQAASGPLTEAELADLSVSADQE